MFSVSVLIGYCIIIVDLYLSMSSSYPPTAEKVVTMSQTAPMIMRMVCTKSVQITADSPPPIVKMAAMASSARIDKYSPDLRKIFYT